MRLITIILVSAGSLILVVGFLQPGTVVEANRGPRSTLRMHSMVDAVDANQGDGT